MGKLPGVFPVLKAKADQLKLPHDAQLDSHGTGFLGHGVSFTVNDAKDSDVDMKPANIAQSHCVSLAVTIGQETDWCTREELNLHSLAATRF